MSGLSKTKALNKVSMKDVVKLLPCALASLQNVCFFFTQRRNDAKTIIDALRNPPWRSFVIVANHFQVPSPTAKSAPITDHQITDYLLKRHPLRHDLDGDILRKFWRVKVQFSIGYHFLLIFENSCQGIHIFNGITAGRN